MNSFLHALTTLPRRLRWEIAAFALLVFARAFATISSPGSSSGLSSLVIILFWWLTFRIVLSETGYATHGGWKTRPFSANAILLARIFFLLALALAAGALRALTLRHLFHPTAAQWIDHLGIVNLSVFLPWLVFTASLALVALFWRAPLPSRARKAGAAVLVIAAVGVVAWTLRTNLDDKYYRKDPSDGHFDAAIQRALPQAKRFIGPWNRTSSPAAPVLYIVPGSQQVIPASQMPATEEVAIPVLRIPFATRTENPAPGLSLLNLSHSAAGGTVTVTLNMIAMNAEIVRQLAPAVPVLGFADGSYGSVVSFENEGRVSYRSAQSDLPRVDYLITFASPLSLPENRDADVASFPPTEILFFTRGLSDSTAPPNNWPDREDAPIPAPDSIPPPEDAPEFHKAVTALIDSLASGGELSPAQHLQIAALPPEAIDPILAYHPWPDAAWEEMIRPFLLRHATDAHKSTLLGHLATDPRLGSLCIEKGWSADAIPVLRQRAVELLPLDAESLVLLAKQDDPTLAPHLAALADRLWGIEKIAPALRESRGFDWPGFVALGWKHHKYLNYDRQGWHYAVWAAQFGDSSAFRKLAEEAARGKKWEKEQLVKLVDGEHEDLTAYLRENLERLRFDPDIRKWTR